MNDTPAASALQSANSRLIWLGEINDRALADRPCLKPGYRPRPVSVHDHEYSMLVMSQPYYGFVGASVADVELLLYSANDDNVARTYFYYGPDAYETLSLRLWHRLCADASCVLDIGAFTGLYSLVARGTNASCTCIAFEPMPHIRHRATMNFVLNGRTESIHIEPYALSDKTQILSLYTSVGPTILDSGGSVTQRSATAATAIDLVQGISLDQYLSSNPDLRPDLLKIDVEFHEVAVLAGARRTLISHRPRFIIEVSKQQTLEQVRGVLLDLEYRVFSIDESRLALHEHTRTDPAGAEYDAIEDVHNVVACPDDGTAEACRTTAAQLQQLFYR